MITTDINVLIYALRPSSPHHEATKEWLERALVDEEPFGLWDVALVSTYRLLTNARMWIDPETSASALGYLDRIREAPAAVQIAPGPHFWETFSRIVREADVRGPLTSDAMLAALAIEHRCRFATFDRDFARFKGLSTFVPTP